MSVLNYHFFAEIFVKEDASVTVEHAKVDTSTEDAMVGLVTYAATTFLEFRTTGVAS